MSTIAYLVLAAILGGIIGGLVVVAAISHTLNRIDRETMEDRRC